jgi:hypothetical protein
LSRAPNIVKFSTKKRKSELTQYGAGEVCPPHPLPKVQIGTTIAAFSYDKHNNLFCKSFLDKTLLGNDMYNEYLDELVL